VEHSLLLLQIPNIKKERESQKIINLFINFLLLMLSYLFSRRNFSPLLILIGRVSLLTLRQFKLRNSYIIETCLLPQFPLHPTLSFEFNFLDIFLATNSCRGNETFVSRFCFGKDNTKTEFINFDDLKSQERASDI
jgi:hypothetical protein